VGELGTTIQSPSETEEPTSLEKAPKSSLEKNKDKTKNKNSSAQSFAVFKSCGCGFIHKLHAVAFRHVEQTKSWDDFNCAHLKASFTCHAI